MSNPILSTDEAKELLEVARKAYQNSYTPYSKFPVGAALLVKGEETAIMGCNVENASFGLAICAERVAVTKAVSVGYKEYRAVAIAAKNTRPCFPCGTCLQFLREFGADIWVIMEDKAGEPLIYPISDMLPYTFTGEDLRESEED